jgi:hypothetical protein
MARIARTAHGRFEKGSRSPNPRGRPVLPPKPLHPLPATLAQAILGIANREVSLRPPGRRQNVRMSRFEAALLRLATGGGDDPRGLIDFVRLVQRAAEADILTAELERKRDPQDYLDEVWDILENGTDEERDRAFQGYLDLLPKLEEISDKELLRLLRQVRPDKYRR